ncbi:MULTISPECIES: TraI/MobA(P) family conjugative relaxase [Desulfovibrio]|uniref:Relaxase/Mobilisation nuclease domain-containing protein n=1 Tax=Desulfovibrio desulfuricans TaxID=876 RepID=A0AA94L2R1_DESDE|nr:TraI/MobA(P) family conjugative relaxase [Desulfovibrio desulfuricans]ATD82366.1 relaxase [Desulfovibrio sp. G11]SFW59083.1 Relaxase/Mobilisation nuclease domain-containing protein [Desulfovibrio desulfuricans]SPD35145.1 Conjugal transfer protein, endonuclease relaxase, MobA/VirD2 [Desulfovibrio sp. G11]
MISKRIPCAPQNDNYARLADYIAAGHHHDMELSVGQRFHDPQRHVEAGQGIAGNRMRQLSECRLASYSQGQKRGVASFLSVDARTDRRAADRVRRDTDFSKDVKPEKCLMNWCAGCWAGDDYELAIREVADTQALNTRTTQEKTYHMIVSFHPEDETKLTPELFKVIEKRFAQALGLSEHQRHCGVHINTENMHMHIAYNLIHPEKLTRVEPWRDYIKRDKLCRELEKEYGLVIDNGRDQAREKSLGGKAAALEAHTGRQSFEGYARDQGEVILAMLEKARTWEDVHQAFARHGLELKRRGAGLVVKNRHGRHVAKASAAHRELSLKKLEARFGAFQASRETMPESELSYGAAPLQKAPNRNQLWQEFQQQYMRRKSSLEAIRQKWAEKRKELEHRPIARRTRTNLMKLTRQYEAEELHAARMQAGGGNWLDFLRQEATKGDDAALAVLRSRQEEVAPETLQFVHERQQARSAYLASKTAVLEKTDLSARAKNRLVSMALMDSLASGATARISKHGSVIYTLPTGGKICDTGRSISFSPEARATALAYMSAKWNVKSRSLDRASGDTVYTLIGGQKVYERKGQNIFERPAVIRRHHQLERERNQSIGR